MKITQTLNLQKTQYEVDFVDVDVDEDLPVFIDPFYIGIRLRQLVGECFQNNTELF